LLGLFDLIRIPENVRGFGSVENRKLAFAELIAHLAFLKTIPAPTFNTVYHIHMLNSLFTVKENSFDQLPHKSQCPIKVLFDVLDVRSIFYCWKALLFDKTVIIFFRLIKYSLFWYPLNIRYSFMSRKL